jgi:hypothetical protein
MSRDVLHEAGNIEVLVAVRSKLRIDAGTVEDDDPHGVMIGRVLEDEVKFFRLGPQCGSSEPLRCREGAYIIFQAPSADVLSADPG